MTIRALAAPVFAFLLLFGAPAGAREDDIEPQKEEAAEEVEVREEPAEAPSAAAQGPVIVIQDGLLSVTLRDAPVGTVITEISRRVGFPAVINPAVSEKLVSTKFDALKLEKGLNRILSLAGAGNYMIKTDSAGRITGLRVFEESAAVRAVVAPAQPGAPAAPQPGAQRPPYRQPIRPFFRGARRPVVPPAATVPTPPPAPSGQELPPELIEEAPPEEELQSEEDQGFLNQP